MSDELGVAHTWRVCPIWDTCRCDCGARKGSVDSKLEDTARAMLARDSRTILESRVVGDRFELVTILTFLLPGACVRTRGTDDTGENTDTQPDG